MACVLPGIAQDLRVVHVVGEIYGNKQVRNLKTGDNLTADDMISYSGSRNMCLLYDGQIKMAFRPSAGTESGKVQEFFQATQDRQAITSRGTAVGDC
jgi:hypothetical protein